MNVVVTGSAGYIGTALMDHLDNPTGLDFPDDVRNETNVARWLSDADTVVHLAATSGVEACENDPAMAMRNNLEATSTVARVCKRLDCRLVFASSQAVHGDTTYGWTKWVGVEVCRRLPDFDWVALEFSNIYGAYEVGGKEHRKNTVIDAFVRMAENGGPITVHKPGTQERNFIHVEDAVNAYLAVLENGSGVIPVRGPDTITINELARQVKRRSGVEITHIDPDRPDGSIEVEVDTGSSIDNPGYRPQWSVERYLDKELGDPENEVGV